MRRGQLGLYRRTQIKKRDSEVAQCLLDAGGPTLAIDEINEEIVNVLGSDVTLRAQEHGEGILLGDGVRESRECGRLSRNELVIHLFEYAVFIGYISESFADFAAGLGMHEYLRE